MNHSKKKLKQVIGNNEYKNIPDDVLVVNIFSRLPAKTLSRFKSVCKQWLSLIEDPSFVDSHLALTKEKGMGYIQILDIKEGRFRYFSMNTSTGLTKELGFTVKVRYPYPLTPPCNGLLCFPEGIKRSFKLMRLCNLTTGETITIPKPQCFLKKRPGALVTAFGLDISSANYKVVCSTENSDSQVEVYTLRSGGGGNSWKTIKCPLGITIPLCLQNPIYTNGNIHWDFESAHSVCKIIAFDLADESFRVIIGPKDVKHIRHHLCELGGSLCMIYENDTSEGKTELSIWMLKDYDKQVWVKQYDLLLPLPCCCWFRYLALPNNAIVFRTDDGPLWCDEKGLLLLFVVRADEVTNSFPKGMVLKS
ncbi:hypothetical protein AQUCO_00700870v1 [Aquilegia coerulea]|uniref:F-box domain-containing protein n=1 Tax=Aquilegia coerulea TaxID=218851 RepID=A0A2G5EM25_AQUCA|nr:hypothetical protein AQUCO_00700870v1 [Aquilegia coerulea]